jgi:hypothetical protein
VKLLCLGIAVFVFACVQNKNVNLKKENAQSIMSVSSVSTNKIFNHPNAPITGSAQVIGGTPPISCRWAIMEGGKQVAFLGKAKPSDGVCKSQPFVTQKPGHYQILLVASDASQLTVSSATTVFVTLDSREVSRKASKDCLPDGGLCHQMKTGTNCYTSPGPYGGLSQECIDKCCSGTARAHCEMEPSCPGKIGCSYFCQAQQK